MSLIDRIKTDQLAARKKQYRTDISERGMAVATSLLTTFLSEVNLVAKNAGRDAPTDEEVIAVSKKFLKSVNENIAVAGDRRDNDWLDDLDIEKDILESYLPKQLSRAELAVLRVGMQHTNKGEWMKFLKENYAGRYDGKIASEVF